MKKKKVRKSERPKETSLVWKCSSGLAVFQTSGPSFLLPLRLKKEYATK